MWTSPEPTQRDKPPSPARKCAQIKHNLRRAQCVHPEYALIIALTQDDGFIEYCSDCDTVTMVYTPTPMRRQVGSNPAP